MFISMLIAILFMFFVVKYGADQFNWISTFISKTALWIVLTALLLYTIFTLNEIYKLKSEVQSSNEIIVESITDNIELSQDDVLKIIEVLNNSSFSTYKAIELTVINTVELSESQKEILKTTFEIRKGYDKTSLKELITILISFFVNLATLLGLYHILDENRKKYQSKMEEEKRQNVKLKTTIRLLKEELNTKKQQKFYEDYYEKNELG